MWKSLNGWRLRKDCYNENEKYRRCKIIYIDDRVGSKELVDLVEDAIPVSLEYGDICFTGNGPDGQVEIGIERKKIGDLINSISSGRLSGHQIPGLLDTYYRTYIIAEGICRENPTTGELEVLRATKWTHLDRGRRKFAYRDVWAYLTTIETMTGIVVRHTANTMETVRHIEWLYRWWSKKWEAHHGHLQLHKPPQTILLRVEKPSLIRRVASELTGIGWMRSREVEKTFGTLRKMFEAKESEWRGIEGIGKLTSRKAWRELHED